MARRTKNSLITKTVLGNLDFDGNVFFSVANGNLLTGPTSALSFDSIAEGIRLFRTQKDSTGNELDITPRTLVVSAAKEAYARQMVRSAEVSRDASRDNLGTSNPLVDTIANLRIEPRLDNTAEFGANAGPDVWFLFGGPSDSPIIQAALDGRHQPIIETEQHDFNLLGQQWRCHEHYGIALGDARTAVRSDGQ